MAKNWNKIWRYVHLAAGLMLVVYHSRIAYVEYGWMDSAWSAETDKFVSTTFVFLVMWTGLAKWPIYPWYKKRQNRKRREEKRQPKSLTPNCHPNRDIHRHDVQRDGLATK